VRRPRLRLHLSWCLAAIAIAAIILALCIQLRRAAEREAFLRARLIAEQKGADANARKARLADDLMARLVGVEWPSRPPSAGWSTRPAGSTPARAPLTKEMLRQVVEKASAAEIRAQAEWARKHFGEAPASLPATRRDGRWW
jgi:hypothetical protein